MPRRARGLSAAAVAKAKVGRFFDGDGLVLTVRGPDSKFWSLRYRQDGRLREMGLGPASGRRAVTLAQARRKARDLFDQHLDGADPLATKNGSRAAARANALLSPSFERAAIDYIEANRSSWSNRVHAEQWMVTLRDYAFPTLGPLKVADIEVAHVVEVLLPIWESKNTTASRLRGRVEKVLDRCKALKQRSGENPAAWKGNLDSLLPKLSKVQRVQQHHAMMAYEAVGDFMLELRAVDGPIARALEFCVLTATRAGETRFATWSEIDLAKKLWTVPGERMKMGVPHAVPLCDRSIEILRAQAETRVGEYIFQVDGAPLDGKCMLRLLQRDLKRPDATMHGFRATFRTWCSERTNFPSEVADIALAHGSKDAIRAAYDRATFREQRRKLAETWGAFCSTSSSRPTGDVIAFGRGV